MTEDEIQSYSTIPDSSQEKTPLKGILKNPSSPDSGKDEDTGKDAEEKKKRKGVSFGESASSQEATSSEKTEDKSQQTATQEAPPPKKGLRFADDDQILYFSKDDSPEAIKKDLEELKDIKEPTHASQDKGFKIFIGRNNKAFVIASPEAIAEHRDSIEQELKKISRADYFNAKIIVKNPEKDEQKFKENLGAELYDLIEKSTKNHKFSLNPSTEKTPDQSVNTSFLDKVAYAVKNFAERRPSNSPKEPTGQQMSFTNAMERGGYRS